MSKVSLSGAQVAIITPFRDGAVDHDALRALIDQLLDGGIQGIVACGTTGEAATLSMPERVAVVQTTLDQVAGRAPVTAGVSTNDTRVALEQASAYRDAGADALLVVTPYYNKPSQEGVYRHFMAVADHCDLPQVVYNVPGRTARRIEVETLARLASHPNIVATKDATGDLVFASETIAACGDDLLLLSGDDFTYMPFLAIGGHGGISVVGNIAPHLTRGVYDAITDGRLGDARQLHLRTVAAARLMFCDSNPTPAKATLALRGTIAHEVRLPLVAMEGAALHALTDGLRREELL